MVRVSGRTEFATVVLPDRPTILANYTANAKLLQYAIGLVWPRTGAGSTFMAALYEVSLGLKKRETPRPVIIPVITDGGDFAYRQYEQVMPEVRKAGAAIHAVTVGDFNSIDHEELRNRARVLAQGTKDTGGQRVNLLRPMAVQPRPQRFARDA